MKLLFQIIALALWLILATTGWAYWTTNYISADAILNFTNPMWDWLLSVYVPNSVDERIDLIFLIGVVVLVVVTAAGFTTKTWGYCKINKVN
jgi:hypothetical protein